MQLYFYLNTIVYGLIKRTFWDHVKEEINSVGDTLKDFFIMIKENTYDLIADKIGGDMAGIFLIGIITVGLMVVLISVINK